MGCCWGGKGKPRVTDVAQIIAIRGGDKVASAQGIERPASSSHVHPEIKPDVATGIDIHER